MAIRVYHSVKPTWGFGTHPTFPHEFAHVATVDVPDAMNFEVFRLTNSIDCGWWENEKVTAHTEASTFRCLPGGVKGTRSTSVGDLIILSDGRILRCAHCGWEDITEIVTEFWLDEVADHIRSEVATAMAALS